jgi:hypothetical protein
MSWPCGRPAGDGTPWMAWFTGGALTVAMAAASVGGPVRAAEQEFAVVTAPRGAPATGNLEFCPADTGFFEVSVGTDGRFFLAFDALEPGRSCRVTFQPAGDEDRHTLSAWTYAPSSWAPEIDPLLGSPRDIVVPTFVVAANGALIFRVDRKPDPEWQRAHRDLAGVTSGLDAPAHWRVAVGTPLVLGGKFASDPRALFGVESVSPGVMIAAAWRPWAGTALVPADRWRRYVEISLAYAGNRYRAGLALDPRGRGDVTFHRFILAGGVGTARGGMGPDVGAGVQFAAGGIYDGSDLLQTQRRTYDQYGFGIYLRAAYTWDLGGLALGPQVRLDYLDYPAAHDEGDFWYGGMPTLLFGLTGH